MVTIDTLEGRSQGRYVVTTAHGTRHLVDLDHHTLIRQGAPGREWGDKLLVADPDALLGGSRPKVAVHYEPITPDGETFTFNLLRDATVGKQMYLENEREWRITSPIASIEVIFEEPQADE